MYRKFGERRCAAFVRALEATGNVTLAAERACVSRSWVLKRRREDPGFDAACRAAIAAACGSLGEREANRHPDKGWGSLDGVELVVRGTTGGRSGAAKPRVQVARARAGQWTARVENRFLAVLAATCNVKAALAEVGMSKASAYAHKKRWAGFERRWHAALAEGAVQLEWALLEGAANPFSEAELPPPVPTPPMGAEEMLHSLHMHKKRLFGIGRGTPGGHGRLPEIGAVTAKIACGIAAVEAAKGLGEGEKAGFAKAVTLRRGTGGG